MSVTAILQQILKSSGLTQQECANRLNVSFATFNSWLHGRSAPRKTAKRKIELLALQTLGAESLDLAIVQATKDAAVAKFEDSKSILADPANFKKLIIAITYNTNSIEGSTMTLADTEAVLFESRVLSSRTLTEQLEARNHREVLEWIISKSVSDTLQITVDFALEIHRRLMSGILPNAGSYRDHNVRILGASVVLANHMKIPYLMERLFAEWSSRRESPLDDLASFHANFEQIHPFSDGNGRVGRLLLLSQALLHKLFPPVVLRERRAAYYKALELAQNKDDIVALSYFVAASIIEGRRLTISG